jgi:hypothetical protein
MLEVMEDRANRAKRSLHNLINRVSEDDVVINWRHPLCIQVTDHNEHIDNLVNAVVVIEDYWYFWDRPAQCLICKIQLPNSPILHMVYIGPPSYVRLYIVRSYNEARKLLESAWGTYTPVPYEWRTDVVDEKDIELLL